MYRIIDDRASGKTGRLMLLAKESEGTIICSNPRAMAQKARAYGITGINFMSYGDFLTSSGLSINNYYIDEKERRGLEGAIRLAKARIAQLETERNERLFQINSVQQPMISNKLVSINLITII